MSDYTENILSNRSERAIPPSPLPPNSVAPTCTGKVNSLWIETMCNYARTASIVLLDNGVLTPSASCLSSII